MPSGSSRTVEPALVGVFALLFAAPVLFLPYVPGLDLPWHAAIIEILHRDEPARFLGYYEVDARLSSYLTLYYAVDWLADVVGGVPAALRVVVGLYVVAFVWSARRLVRAFGGDGTAAILAAPAAWSVTVEYGFVAYALGYPLTFWLWAVGRELMDGRPAPWRLGALVVLSGLLAITHPFAAVLALVGLLVIVGTHLERGRAARAAAAVAAALVAAVPAAIAVATLAGDQGASAPPELVREADLWTRLTNHRYTPLLEALTAAPARLFGYLSHARPFALAIIALQAAIGARLLAGRGAAEPGARGRTLGWLCAILALGYLVTPFTFEWPRLWYGAQPRILPLLWVAGLAALRWSPAPARGRGAARALTTGAGAVALCLVWLALWPLAREGRDLRAVIAAAEPGARTVALVDQPPTREREPASPWRHAPAYVLVERGGYVANLPFTRPSSGNAGVLVPVRLADGAPAVPPSPPLDQPWTFDWDRHAPGYDQLLVRHRAPDGHSPYVAGHEDRIELVERAGRWRLYRLVD